MGSIYDQSALDSIQLGDQLAVYSVGNGDTRRAALSLILAFMQANLDLSPTDFYQTQYSAPSATGFSVQITDGSNNIHLILTPVAGYAAGTIVLPTNSNCVDKQEVLVNCTQSVSTLTINKNGATALTGAPTSLSANGFFRLKYDLPTKTWYRIG